MLRAKHILQLALHLAVEQSAHFRGFTLFTARHGLSLPLSTSLSANRSYSIQYFINKLIICFNPTKRAFIASKEYSCEKVCIAYFYRGLFTSAANGWALYL